MKKQILTLLVMALTATIARAEWTPIVEQGKTWTYFAEVGFWDNSQINVLVDLRIEGTEIISDEEYSVVNIYVNGEYDRTMAYMRETADNNVYAILCDDYFHFEDKPYDKLWYYFHWGAPSSETLMYSMNNPEAKTYWVVGGEKIIQDETPYTTPLGRELKSFSRMGSGFKFDSIVEGIGIFGSPFTFLLGDIGFITGFGSTSLTLISVTDSEGEVLYYSQEACDYMKEHIDGVEGVAVDTAAEAPAYYDLRGVRVADPTPGALYIRKQGSDASKFLLK